MTNANDNQNMDLVPENSQVLTIAEMCAAYRISRNRVFDEMKAGRLVAKRLGGRVLISRKDAEDWWQALPKRMAA